MAQTITIAGNPQSDLEITNLATRIAYMPTGFDSLYMKFFEMKFTRA